MDNKEEDLTCYNCKNFDRHLKEQENRPCKYRHYPDYRNVCFNFQRKGFNIVIKGEAG